MLHSYLLHLTIFSYTSFSAFSSFALKWFRRLYHDLLWHGLVHLCQHKLPAGSFQVDFSPTALARDVLPGCPTPGVSLCPCPSPPLLLPDPPFPRCSRRGDSIITRLTGSLNLFIRFTIASPIGTAVNVTGRHRADQRDRPNTAVRRKRALREDLRQRRRRRSPCRTPPRTPWRPLAASVFKFKSSARVPDTSMARATSTPSIFFLLAYGYAGRTRIIKSRSHEK
jgi:hypothetical protein